MDKYKWSYYNYLVVDKDVGYFLIYNTKSGAVGSGKLSNISENDLKDDPNLLLNHEYFSFFIENGMIIDSSINEIEELKKLHNNPVSKNITLTILPTVSCNFGCSYCFVNTMPATSDTSMPPDIRNGILKYIDKVSKENEIEMVEIIWFGGEPLLAVDSIEKFMTQLRVLANVNNFVTSCTIVTNGYLLTPEVFDRLYDNLVRVYQITLDGTKETHDIYRRILNDNSPTFDIIYQNLLAIKCKPEKDVLVQIRANFLKNNIDSMKDLLKMYEQDFKDDNRFSLCFRPIIDFEKGMPSEFLTIKKEARNLEFDMMRLMEEHQIDVGDLNRMFSVLPTPIDRWCRIGETYRYIISYDGSLYHCNACVSDKSAQIGKIDKDGNIITVPSITDWQYSVFDYSDVSCIKCRRLPICMGGCVRERNKTGMSPCHWTDDYIYRSMKYVLQQSL